MGCYSGEPITVVSRRRGGCTVSIKDGRYNIDNQLAEAIQNSIVAETDNVSRGIKQRTDLLILNGTTVPAVIVEVVFLSNVGDALKISQEDYQDIVAEAIADANAMGILDMVSA